MLARFDVGNVDQHSLLLAPAERADVIVDFSQYRGKTLFEVLYKNGQVDKFSLDQVDGSYANNEAQTFGFYVQKGLFEEYSVTDMFMGGLSFEELFKEVLI